MIDWTSLFFQLQYMLIMVLYLSIFFIFHYLHLQVSAYLTFLNHVHGNVTMMMTMRCKLLEEEEKLSPKVKVISEFVVVD